MEWLLEIIKKPLKNYNLSKGMYVESNPNKVHVFGIQIINRSLIRVTAYADYSIYDLNRK